MGQETKCIECGTINPKDFSYPDDKKCTECTKGDEYYSFELDALEPIGEDTEGFDQE